MNTTLALSADQISKLESALLELPGKFGLPIIQLLQLFVQENSKAPVVEEAEVVK